MNDRTVMQTIQIIDNELRTSCPDFTMLEKLDLIIDKESSMVIITHDLFSVIYNTLNKQYYYQPSPKTEDEIYTVCTLKLSKEQLLKQL